MGLGNFVSRVSASNFRCNVRREKEHSLANSLKVCLPNAYRQYNACVAFDECDL